MCWKYTLILIGETTGNFIAAAKLTIGLEPMNENDFKRVASIHKISDDKQIMKLAVLEFLKAELKSTQLSYNL